MTIFFFSQWYPQKYDAMSGLFVRKHAECIANQGNLVHVFHVVKHEQQFKREYVIKDDSSGVVEHIIYLPIKKSVFSEIKALYDVVRNVMDQGVLPDILHINVLATKIALVAYFLNKKYNIPFVVTEHWSGYLKINNTFNQRKFQAKILRHIAKEASCIMPVSELLKNAMLDCGVSCRRWEVVPNVVDDFFYEESKAKEGRNKKRILHVSCFDNVSKNTFGIITAIAELVKKRTDFELVMVGTGKDICATKKLAEQHHLIENNIVNFIGEKSPRQVKELFDKSDFFLLFSNFESASVVISEALVCGLPIVSSSVGITPEFITSNVGRLVAPNNISELVDALDFMLDNYSNFDSREIKAKGKRFSYNDVGRQIINIYNDVLNGTKIH